MATPVLTASSEADAVEYTRRLFNNIMDWYKNADQKAQLILTLDGAFLAFLTSSAFRKPDELAKVVEQIKGDSWFFLMLMCVTMTASIASSLVCLHSRTYSQCDLQELLTKAGVQKDKPETYVAQVLWFFQMITQLDPVQLRTRLQTVDKKLEIDALASQISALSEKVARKHKWVNRGFLLAGASLIFFLLAAAGYVMRVHA